MLALEANAERRYPAAIARPPRLITARGPMRSFTMPPASISTGVMPVASPKTLPSCAVVTAEPAIIERRSDSGPAKTLHT